MGNKGAIFAKINKGLELLLSIPKSFYVSWRLTSFKKVWSFPVICRYNCKLVKTSGSIHGGGKMKIGFNQTGLFDAQRQRTLLKIEGTIELNGFFSLGAGSRLEVGSKGTLVIMGIVSNSAGTIICCHDRIEIGDNTVISWNTQILDKDFHYVLDLKTGKTGVDHKPIFIGNNVWLCAGSMLLKGSYLPDGCILAAGSVLNRKITESNCLLQGNPAVIVRSSIIRSDSFIEGNIDENNN